MKAKRWQMQEAKARLSEVIQRACKEGPQEISIRGKVTAIMLSEEQYKHLTAPKTSFIEFLKKSPLFESELEIERDQSTCRDIEL